MENSLAPEYFIGANIRSAPAGRIRRIKRREHEMMSTDDGRLATRSGLRGSSGGILGALVFGALLCALLGAPLWHQPGCCANGRLGAGSRIGSNLASSGRAGFASRYGTRRRRRPRRQRKPLNAAGHHGCLGWLPPCRAIFRLGACFSMPSSLSSLSWWDWLSPRSRPGRSGLRKRSSSGTQNACAARP